MIEIKFLLNRYTPPADQKSFQSRGGRGGEALQIYNIDNIKLSINVNLDNLHDRQNNIRWNGSRRTLKIACCM